MTTITPDDLWIYIYEHGEVRTKDLEQEFVTTHKISRGTMYKYKRLLESQGRIVTKTVREKPPYHLYYVPSQFHDQVKRMRHHFTFSLNANDLEWEEPPDDFHLTNVRRKILWTDGQTGATAVLLKFLPGEVIAKGHIHPDANHIMYVLEGEFQPVPDGHPRPGKGSFVHCPKGVKHGGGRMIVTKEGYGFAYYDGPQTYRIVE
jgi:quercetin dioxygenase-like cupin family protein